MMTGTPGARLEIRRKTREALGVGRAACRAGPARGGPRATRATPSSPSAAVTTSNPSTERVAASESRDGESSSMIRMVGCLRRAGAPVVDFAGRSWSRRTAAHPGTGRSAVRRSRLVDGRGQLRRCWTVLHRRGRCGQGCRERQWRPGPRTERADRRTVRLPAADRRDASTRCRIRCHHRHPKKRQVNVTRSPRH